MSLRRATEANQKRRVRPSIRRWFRGHLGHVSLDVPAIFGPLGRPERSTQRIVPGQPILATCDDRLFDPKAPCQRSDRQKALTMTRDYGTSRYPAAGQRTRPHPRRLGQDVPPHDRFSCCATLTRRGWDKPAFPRQLYELYAVPWRELTAGIRQRPDVEAYPMQSGILWVSFIYVRLASRSRFETDLTSWRVKSIG
jgi:hypothetical protein